MHRVVLDPGVLISGLISPRGAPAEILVRWTGGAFDVVVSQRLLEEVRTVLARPKFRSYVDEVHADDFVAVLEAEGVLVTDPADVARVTADPHDDYLVALAREARADVIVSGDAHLTKLELDPPVLTPREFLDRLGPS